MTKRFLLILLAGCAYFLSAAQEKTYSDSIQSFQQDYVKKHEVVTGRDKKLMHFFPVNENYRIAARFERIYEGPWFKMETSGKDKQIHRVYGILHFSVNDTTVKLHIYQSQRLMDIKEYADHLFVPFTDLTCGESSYENGRYIDLTIDDLKNGYYLIDFNKAYNPYCAYVSNRYNCPVPPKENDLAVAIKAGEMKFEKEH